MANVVSMESLKYEELSPEQREKIARSLEEWGSKRPDSDEPVMWAGATGYTASQIAQEIREGTDFGIDFVNSLPPNTLDELDTPHQPELTQKQSAAIIRARMAEFRTQLDALEPPSCQ